MPQTQATQNGAVYALRENKLNDVLQNHWSPVTFTVIAGSTISSNEYKREKLGMEITTKITQGVSVQTISIKLPWIKGNALASPAWSLERKSQTVRKTNHTTNPKIHTKKNIKSWCKSTIPSITGEAPSWKSSCQRSGTSQKVAKNNLNQIMESKDSLPHQYRLVTDSLP